ncbi:tRNA (guanosine(37)-N1)-methyltransferase TrmD [Rubeoparvulum massiliense]|uniref:tRNA (guanosine(37)-N1)-methyltransferase TrmD n=1 Tax=Rubeoparvulum massiliense TaxID=1631346 RepID=UPI0009E617B3|nr:tRNA (guanosine(37)-N1)-methyltransferase TrmD [Rubeoparvulum massiliense]
MRIDILTLFPEMFEGVLHASMLGRAEEKGLVQYHLTNFRKYATDKHAQVDDYPYGGGEGMVLKPDPMFAAMDDITRSSEEVLPASSRRRVLLLCPQGEPYHQSKAVELARDTDHLILICGHYEGYDERIRTLVTDEVSIGDYILTGGELGAMVVIDSVVRLLPGVLGNEDSPIHDSFSNGLLEHPQYTRPAMFRGLTVPDVLLSGNHELIRRWRLKESLRRTYLRRPDLLEGKQLTKELEALLDEVIGEENAGDSR